MLKHVGCCALLVVPIVGCKVPDEATHSHSRPGRRQPQITSAGPVEARAPKLPLNMVLVPKGAFSMGCPSLERTCFDKERPEHRVHLRAYYIDKTEVTVAAFRRCVEAGACSADKLDEQSAAGGKHRDCTWSKRDQDAYPVTCTTWRQAAAYCKWNKKRLPTEAEWEKAARGTDGRIFPWGNFTPSCEVAVLDDIDMPNVERDGCGTNGAMPVGSKPKGASPYGALDMGGNVWEWVADYYDESYYDTSPNKDPTGPSSGTERVYRGGGWRYGSPHFFHVWSRFPGGPEETVNATGFRCAKSL